MANLDLDTQRVGKWTVGELRAAFDRIADPEDWRNPITAVVCFSDVPLYAAAVDFFTATPLVEVRRTPTPGSAAVVVTAKGYRAGPAGP